MRTGWVLLIAAWLTCVFSAPASNEFVAVTWLGDALTIDLDTGTSSLLGKTGYTALNAMALDPRDGAILTKSQSPNRILEIDPQTGAAVELGGLTLNSVTAMAFSPSGHLFVVDQGRDLYRVELEPSCCTKNFIAELDLHGIVGMSFDAEGTLYAWSTVYGLMTIDPITAVTVDLNGEIDGGQYDVQTLTFGPDGTLYGVQDTLQTIDRQTGIPTPIGPSGVGNVSGFEWVASTCPGDFDGNDAVDFVDLVSLLSFWGPCSGCPADLDRDGATGFTDLVSLLSVWGPCSP